jgi:membrane-bound metal-dependent hydrolase YbcI (DUF457 family)
MPSPLGHAIAGAAAGWLVVGAPSLADRATRTRAGKEVLLFAALAMLPDVDLLVGGHRGPTHSIGAAVIVGACAFLLSTMATGGWHSSASHWSVSHHWFGSHSRLAVACAAAYGSHIPLDWLSHDNTPPIGIMALWPVSHDYYASQVQVFLAISRRYYHGWRFVIQNTLAVVRELAILIPAIALVIVLRPRRAGTARELAKR